MRTHRESVDFLHSLEIGSVVYGYHRETLKKLFVRSKTGDTTGAYYLEEEDGYAPAIWIDPFLTPEEAMLNRRQKLIKDRELYLGVIERLDAQLLTLDRIIREGDHG